ncbi:retrovirus-related pol polyprotein from transposon TNT 1-94 [Tanacetum coccineum]
MSTEVHQADETVTMSNELDLRFGPLFDEYFNRENQVVLKSSAVTTTDASNKRQQQPDSTSSTSTLATTVTVDGNFDLAQVDQGSQIKMIQVKEMMQDNDLKNSKSKDKGSKSRSQSMNEQSRYKQDKTITRQSINVKLHIFDVIGAEFSTIELVRSTQIKTRNVNCRTPEQNGIVERRNHTLVEAARTMLSAAKVPLFFWAEAIATACFTQNCSLVIP